MGQRIAPTRAIVGGRMETNRNNTETSRPPRVAEPGAEKRPLEAPRHGAQSSGGELRAILRAALEAIPAGAFLLTSAGAVLEVNAPGRAWLARDKGRATVLREALRGRPPADLVITKISGAGGASLVVQRDLVEDRDRSSIPPQSP
jgi:PAS domain-containing protein